MKKLFLFMILAVISTGLFATAGFYDDEAKIKTVSDFSALMFTTKITVLTAQATLAFYFTIHRLTRFATMHLLMTSRNFPKKIFHF